MRRRRRSPLAALALLGALTLPIARDAEACPWDWETYHAEQKSLPCVFDALLGYWPKHTDAYHETRIAAADAGLRWVPGWTAGLDAKGLSLLVLGRLEQAEVVMKQRHAIAPHAYPGHANLGTLHTFNGEFDAALEHIDAAMALEPKAHFGREGYHRALVVFLGRVAADPAIASRENFLGIALSEDQRRNGSKALFDSLNLKEDGFDALVSMITVYGADQLPEIYLALGELLAARGHPRLAYTAYRRARDLGHVRRDELRRWMKQLEGDLTVVGRARYRATHGNPEAGGYRGIGERYKTTSRKAATVQARWAEWERGQLEGGLAIWTQAGLDQIYARMHEERRRCDAPQIIADGQAPLAKEDRTIEHEDDETETGGDR